MWFFGVQSFFFFFLVFFLVDCYCKYSGILIHVLTNEKDRKYDFWARMPFSPKFVINFSHALCMVLALQIFKEAKWELEWLEQGERICSVN